LDVAKNPSFYNWSGLQWHFLAAVFNSGKRSWVNGLNILRIFRKRIPQIGLTALILDHRKLRRIMRAKWQLTGQLQQGQAALDSEVYKMIAEGKTRAAAKSGK
jgi:hypothetical protein